MPIPCPLTLLIYLNINLMRNKNVFIVYTLFFFSLTTYCCSKGLEKGTGLSNIPTRNELFIKREDHLKKISTGLKNRANLFSIIGMAGIGKTQLAKEYALTQAKSYDLIWWFDANQDFLAQFRELGHKLSSTQACSIPDNSQMSLETWLDAVQVCYKKHYPRVLLIIDDTKTPEQIGLIKQTLKNVSILLTSRNSTMRGDHMVLKSFSRKESLDYLNKALPGNPESSSNELAELLNDYPLALAQAVSFIKSHASLTLEEYLNLYKEKKNSLWAKEEKLIQEKGEDWKLLEDYHHTVATTFSLLLDQIHQSSPHALEALKLVSFLGTQNIPKRFLKTWMVDQRKLTDFDFHDAISSLIRYSIFEKNESNKDSEETYNIHALLHEFIRDKLKDEEKEFYSDQSIHLIGSFLPESSYQLWKVLFDDRYLEYHLESLLKLAQQYHLSSEELLVLRIKHLHNLCFSKSDFDGSIEKFSDLESKIKEYKNLRNFERARFLAISGNMAAITKNCNEAISISEQAVDLLKNIPTQEAREDLFFVLVNNLMEFYTNKGDLQKAEETGKVAERLLSYVDHPTYLILYYFMRSLQLMVKGEYAEALKQGDLKKAEALVSPALKGFNDLFKKEDENSVQGFSHIILGELYEKQLNLSKALEHYKKAEEIYTHLFKTIEVDDLSYLYKNFVLLGEKMKDELIIKKYLQLLTEHFHLGNPNTKEAMLYLDEQNVPAFN